MPFPAAHNLLQIIGSIKVGPHTEMWTNTLRIGRDGGGSPVEMPAAVMDDVALDLTNWWTAIKPFFPVDTRLMGFKFNAVGTDGLYVSQTTTNERTFGATGEGLAGGATGHGLPPQCAVVVTLHTAKRRGLAARGRIYLPPPGVAQVTSGRLVPATRDTMAQATATLCRDLSNWPGVDALADPGDVCIYSKGNAAIPNGARSLVTATSVGDVFDTQRRRRNDLQEQLSPLQAV